MGTPSQRPVASQQAHKVIARFGNANKLHHALERISDGNENYRRTRSSIIRWTYPRNKGGTNGVIPSAAWPAIARAARYVGIIFTEEDMQL